MTWQTGLILICVLLVLLAIVSLWLHGRNMRLRQYRRQMIDRYSRMEWKP
jgi:hypothetical protein